MKNLNADEINIVCVVVINIKKLPFFMPPVLKKKNKFSDKNYMATEGLKQL